MKLKADWKFPKIHIGMRIWKTVIAVFICAVLGMIFNIHPFYSMIAAILCMQANTSESRRGKMRGYFYRRNGGGIGTADNRLYSACAVFFFILYFNIALYCTGHLSHGFIKP